MFLYAHPQIPLGYVTHTDLSDTMLRGLLRWGREGSEEGARVLHRVGLSLRGIGSGLPTPHSLYPNRIFSVRLPL
jgi:hypothetical protein